MEALISQEKFEELTKELDELRTVRRREVAEQLEYARSLGDLSENAEYQEAREMQAAVEERIGKLESILKNAKIVSGNPRLNQQISAVLRRKSLAETTLVGVAAAKNGKTAITQPQLDFSPIL